MEPRQQGPAGGEQLPVPQGGYEQGISGAEQAPSRQIERAAELTPDLGGARAEAQQVAAPSLGLPTVAPVAPQSGADVSSADSSLSTLVAGDDDLIEKEWVDKAKKILAETKEDPYRREHEISKLQIEYIRLRYGREIGSQGE